MPGFVWARTLTPLLNPRARRIHLVVDRRKSLTDYHGETAGNWLWNRFTVRYTPTHGSWLNQAGIEIGCSPANIPAKGAYPVWRPCNGKASRGAAHE